MNLLDQVFVSAPCPISWESMEGNDRVRHCSTCEQSVYNLTDMSQTEAEMFLQSDGGNSCVQFFRRADGTIMTDNCPVALRAIRKKCRLLIAVAASFVGTILSFFTAASAGQLEKDKSGTKQTFSLFKTVIPAGAALGGGVSPALGVATGGVMMGLSIHNNPSYASKIKVKERKNVILLGGECIEPGPNTTSLGTPDQTQTIDKKQQYADGSAYNLYNLGHQSEKKGKFLVARTQFTNALKATESQSNPDPKLTDLIKSRLQKLNWRLGLSEPLSGYDVPN